MAPVVDEHGRLTAETKRELARVFRERPELLERFVDGLAEILHDAVHRPKVHRVDEPAPPHVAPFTDEQLPEELPAVDRPGERRR